MAATRIRDAIKRGLQEALDNDPSVIIMGEDIGHYGGAYAVTSGFLEKYGPDRIKDTPISEAGFTGMAIGAATSGLRPVVEFMSISFTLVAFDQIINMAANLRYMSGGQIKIPLVIRAPTGAGSQLGATHSQSFESWIAETPGMRCVCPSNAYDALGLLRSALKEDNPVFFAEPALLYSKKHEVPDEYYELPIGEAHIVRPGKDVTLISYGHGMKHLYEAADELATRGVEAEVIDLRSLSPLDIDTLVASTEKTNRVLVLDMARKVGGFMGEVAAQIQEAASGYLDGPVVRVAAEDTPWPYNKSLENHSLPSTADVLNALAEHYSI